MEQKKNPHANHRQRLYALAEKVGVENLTDIQMLELLLTYVIPRKDTNELAHKLLDEFGSFSAVLDAPINSLRKIDGVGHRTAQLISFMPSFFFLYQTKRKDEKIRFSSRQELIKYISNYLKLAQKEQFYIIGLNANSELIKNKLLSTGKDNSVMVDIKSIVDFISAHSPHSIIIAHSHCDYVSKPSLEDVQATRIIANLVRATGVKFLDHIIIGKDGHYSFAENSQL